MGSFITNIQLYKINKNILVDHVDKYMEEQGYKKVNSPSQKGRRVLILQREEGPWTSLYDDGIIAGEIDKLGELTKYYSKHLSTYALGVTVCDSDYVQMDGYYKDQLQTSISNFNEKKLSIDGLNKWADIIDKDVDIKEVISELSQSKADFAEEYVQVISESLLINTEDCINIIEDIDENSDDVTSLYYEIQEDTEENNVKTQELQLTKLQLGKFLSDQEKGAQGVVNIDIRNLGRGSKGLQLIVQGDGIEHQCIKPLFVSIYNANGEKQVVDSVFVSSYTADNQLFYVCVINELNISQHNADNPFEVSFSMTMTIERMNKKKKEWFMYIVPSENRETGYTGFISDSKKFELKGMLGDI